MEYKILNKQNNSSRCIVCGDKNPMSLETRFYELENGELVALFETKDQHQSYPGRTHGGMAAAILDETIGRAVCITEPETWGVTVELNIKYKAPVPTEAKLKAVARITRNTRKLFEGEGELLLEDGTVAVTAWGKYMKLNINDISEMDLESEWYLLDEEDPEVVDI